MVKKGINDSAFSEECCQDQYKHVMPSTLVFFGCKRCQSKVNAHYMHGSLEIAVLPLKQHNIQGQQ